ncbi:MAG: type II toxin-antitoxin system VapC family toxin [Thermoanaerobaculia bacterium]
MNLVDSSGWLEYFGDGPNADAFAPAVEDASSLVVPTICLFEVAKRLLTSHDEDAALQAVATMQEGTVVALDEQLAVSAALLSASERLPLADSVILATARSRKATLWTQDADLRGLDGVRYVEHAG